MPTVDEVIDSFSIGQTPERVRVLDYFREHSDEVYRSIDMPELATKIGWERRPSGLYSVISALAYEGLLGSLIVKQFRFFGSREAIDALESRLPEEVKQRHQVRRGRW